MRKHRKIAGDWAGFDCRPYWVVSATMAARLGMEGSRPCASEERSRLRSPPAASAAPDYSPSEVANTVSSVTGSARDYLNNHPGTNQAVTAAYSQPPSMAAGTLRSYLTANPTEYVLRGSWHRSVTSSGSATTRCFRLDTTNSWLADR